MNNEIEVFPQFADIIAGPERVHGVQTEDAWREMALHVGRNTRRFHQVHDTTEALPAFVNGGRWIVRCPCGNAPSAHSEWGPDDDHGLALCLECGKAWLAAFPPNHKQIEARLLVRLVRNRNWDWHESLSKLERENTEHGLPARLEGVN